MRNGSIFNCSKKCNTEGYVKLQDTDTKWMFNFKLQPYSVCFVSCTLYLSSAGSMSPSDTNFPR